MAHGIHFSDGEPFFNKMASSGHQTKYILQRLKQGELDPKKLLNATQDALNAMNERQTK